MKFSDLGLSPEILRAVEEAGYSQPTPIQERAIPIVLQGRDVMGCAQTGTGKTASFALPMLDILATGRARARMPRALILEPTRELAAQVSESIAEYGKYMKFETALLIGGTSMDDQNRQLEQAPDIIIATPGRLLDHADRGQVMLRGVKILVIDETDRMLDMGFIPDVQRIVKLLPPLRQTLFFSATLSLEIRSLGAEFVHNPKEITVAPPSSPATTVRQAVITVHADAKRQALRRLIALEKIEQAIIFLNRKRDVDILLKSMKKHGFSAAGIHGDLAQSVRTETLEKFKEGKIAFLIASDVAARGLDIEELPWVINFDVPINAEDYVHRIGRTARAGRSGTAFTLATPDDGRFLAQITKLIGKEIPPITIEGVETPAPLSEEDARARRGRSRGGRGRGGDRRGGRGRSHGGDAPARAAEAHARPPQPVQAAAPVHPNPPPAARSGREEHGHEHGHGRGGRGGHEHLPRQDRHPERQQRPAPQPRPDPSAPDSVRAATVMGGHVPAFLLRGSKR
jgi:superfamily II DNA/RNA helicase